MRKIWREFIAKSPNLKTTRSHKKNKCAPLSFWTFWNIFNKDLRDMLSFREARVDTCQFCAQTQRKLLTICADIKKGNVRRSEELQLL